MKDRIIIAAIMLLAALLLTSCQSEDKPEQTKPQDKPVASIDNHKPLEDWTITVYAEEDRVFSYTGTIELGRPREIIVRVEEGESIE